MRAEGFSNTSAMPLPASTCGRSGRSARSSTPRSSSASRSSISRRCLTSRRPTPRPRTSSASRTPARMATPSSISASETVSGGAKRRRARRDRVDHQAGGRGLRRPRPWRRARRSARPPAAARGRAHGRPAASRSSTLGQAGAGPRRPARGVLALHDGQHGPGRSGGERLAAEGRGVVTRAAWPRPRRAGPSRRRWARRCRAPWPSSPRRAARRSAGSRTTARCGPRPVCTSSTISRRPRSSHRRRAPRKNSTSAGLTPPSPCTGSSRMAATVGSMAASSAVEVVPARRGGSPRACGWKASCLAGWPVAWSVASVRPWKEP